MRDVECADNLLACALRSYLFLVVKRCMNRNHYWTGVSR
jgi:hypothetical protein